jgi:hypothetical protein
MEMPKTTEVICGQNGGGGGGEVACHNTENKRCVTFIGKIWMSVITYETWM